jgi:hypothetical protein
MEVSDQIQAPPGRDPGTYWIGGSVDPSRCGRCAEDENLALPGIEPGSSKVVSNNIGLLQANTKIHDKYKEIQRLNEETITI